MRFTLTIDCENAAFGTGLDAHAREVNRLLCDVVDRIRRGKVSGVIMDTNGNSVGRFDFEGKR